MTKTHKRTFMITAIFAVLCFFYAVAVLGFQWFYSSCTAQKVNAVWLAVVWAICPPIWFWVECLVWKDTVRKDQDRARDFWLGLGAIVLFLADKRFGK